MLQYAVIVSATEQVDCGEIEEMIEAAGYRIVKEDVTVNNFEAVQMWIFSKFDQLQYSFQWTYSYEIEGPFYRVPLVFCHRMPLLLRGQYLITSWAFMLKSALFRISKTCLVYLSSQIVRKL
jgi:hypothetical protein